MFGFEDVFDFPREMMESSDLPKVDPTSLRPKLTGHLNTVDRFRYFVTSWIRGSRFMDLNEDQGVYYNGSGRGIELEFNTERLLKQANEKEECGDYKAALELYTQALKNSIQIVDNGGQLCELFQRRSNVYHLLKEYDKALKDAELAIQCCPVVVMGPLRLVETLESMQNFKLAFSVITACMELYRMECSEWSMFLKPYIRLASKVEAGFETISSLDFSAKVWNPVIIELADEGSWSSVRIVLMGTDDLTPLVSCCDASRIQLSGLLTFCNETAWKQWGQKLTLLLIRYGAKYESLCADRKYPLHSALRMGLKTGTFDLLKHVLSRNGPFTQLTDNNGDSLYHIACSERGPCIETAVRLLINHDINPNIKNREGKMALELLDTQDSIYKTLKDKMEQRISPGDPKPPVAGTKPEAPDSNGNTFLGTTKENSLHSTLAHSHEENQEVKNWSKTKIKKWMDANKIGQHKQKFRDISGPLLYELIVMQDTAPEMFYRVLEESVQLSFVEVLKVSAVLRHCRS